MARGRKRKPGKRTPCGKLSAEETRREVMATALDARQRHYRVTAAQARDQRLCSVMGRLAFTGAITQPQYEAGQKFGEIYHRHQLVTGMPLPSPSSVSGLMAASGHYGGSGEPASTELIERVRRRYDDALQVLARCDQARSRLAGRPPSRLVYRLACLDEDAGPLPQPDLASLCHGLDELGELFGLVREGSRKIL